MKVLHIVVALLLFASSVYGQAQTNKRKREIDVHYNWVFVGKNLSVNYNHFFNRHALTLGLKTHFNQTNTADKNYVFKKKGYAGSFKESIGMNIGYSFDLLRNSELVVPYLYYQSQISYLKMKYVSRFRDSNNTIITTTRISQPYFISENTVGFGLKIKIYKDLYFNQSAGVGIATFTGRSLYANDKGKYPTTIEGAYLLRLGITYRI